MKYSSKRNSNTITVSNTISNGIIIIIGINNLLKVLFIVYNHNIMS